MKIEIMQYAKTESTDKPDEIVLEDFKKEYCLVSLTTNVVEKIRTQFNDEKLEEGSKYFEYTLYQFKYFGDYSQLEKNITENFESWADKIKKIISDSIISSIESERLKQAQLITLANFKNNEGLPSAEEFQKIEASKNRDVILSQIAADVENS